MKLSRITALVLINLFSFSHLALAQNANELHLKKFTSNDFEIIKNAKLFQEIDFYNSSKLTLMRKLRSDEVTAKNGILKVVNNERFEYVILPKLNIGRYRFNFSNSSIYISFDARSPGKSFKFTAKTVDSGETLFYIDSRDDERHLIVVQYGGENYNVAGGNDSGFDDMGEPLVYLLYDNHFEEKKETVSDTLRSYPSRR